MYISRGNRKVKCNIFNLPTGITCKKSCKFCYARKAEQLYPEVLPSRHRNLLASKKDNFVVDMIDILLTRRNKVVRIHESGDFYSIDYINKWYDIAESLPDRTFYAYTKRDDLFNQDLLDKRSKNFILIWSHDKIDDVRHSIPAGYDKMASITTNEKIVNCPSQTKNKVCVKQCKKCCSKKSSKEIVFLLH